MSRKTMTAIMVGVTVLTAAHVRAANVVSWTFSGSGSDHPSISATSGIPGNTGMNAVTLARTPYANITISGSTIYCGSWSLGAAWETSAISTLGYGHLSISNGAYGSGTAPRDFKIQYRLGASGTWTDVQGASMAHGTSLTGYGPFALPEECGNTNLFLRWVVWSTTNVNGVNDSIGSGGNSRIADISLQGDLIYPAPPMVAVTPPSITVREGDVATATVEALDWEGGTLSVVVLSDDIVGVGDYFEDGIFEWTAGMEGVYVVRFAAEDAVNNFATTNFLTITVTPVSPPAPPVIAPVAPQSVYTGKTLSIKLAMSTTDDTLITSTNVADNGSVVGTFGLTNGVFFYVPDIADVGEQSFTVTAANEVGTTTRGIVVTVTAVPSFLEDFETGSKTGYNTTPPTNTVKCTLGVWYMTNTLIGTSTDDKMLGTKSARMQGTSANGNAELRMEFDKPNGAGAISFYCGTYGSDSANQTLTVYVSNNGGVSWDEVGKLTTIPTTLSQIVFADVNVLGNVRVKFVKAVSGTLRVNVDDIIITDYDTPTVPVIKQVPPQTAMVGYVLNVPVSIASGNGEAIVPSVNANGGVTGAYGLSGGVFSYTPVVADIGPKSFTVSAANAIGSATPMTFSVVVETAPSLFEDFEQMTGSGAYAGSSVSFASGRWLVYGYTTMEANDRFEGSRSVRLRANNSDTNNAIGGANMVQMGFDKPNGVGSVKFKYGSYGSNSGGALFVDYSLDGGASWVRANAGSPVVALNKWQGAMEDASVAILRSGNVRIRIVKESQGSSTLVNIDNIGVTDCALDAPVNVAVSSPVSGVVKASWSPVASADRYAVELFAWKGIANHSVLQQDFSVCTNFSGINGANSGTLIGAAGTARINDSNGAFPWQYRLDGWTGAEVFCAMASNLVNGATNAMVKMGASSALGWLQTPALDLTDGQQNSFTVSADIGAWNTLAEKTAIDVLLVDFLANTTNTLDTWSYSKATMQTLSGTYVGGTASCAIRFTAKQASGNRFFLDNVHVTKGALQKDVHTTAFTPTPSITLKGVTPGATLLFDVRAENADGTIFSDWTGELPVKVGNRTMIMVR